MGYILSDEESSHAVQDEFSDRLRVIDGISGTALVHELEAKGFQFMDELMDGEDLRSYALIRKGGAVDKPSSRYSRLRDLLSGSVRVIRAVEERPMTHPSVGGAEASARLPHEDRADSQHEEKVLPDDEVVSSESAIRLAVHGRHMAARALRARRLGLAILEELPFEVHVNAASPSGEMKEGDPTPAVIPSMHLLLEWVADRETFLLSPAKMGDCLVLATDGSIVSTGVTPVGGYSSVSPHPLPG
jgi:hypothetical protein